jgi:SAM-dependent methyltransferase
MCLPLRDASVDVVLGFDIYEHLSSLDDALLETSRVLKPNGIVHAVIPCDGEPTTIVGWMHLRAPWLAQCRVRHTGHVIPLTFEQVKTAFCKQFEIIDVKFSLHFVSQIRDAFKWLVDCPLGIDTYNPRIRSHIGRLIWRIYGRVCGVVDVLGTRQSGP